VLQNPQDREAALAFSKRIEEDSFRAGLLVGFMGDHMGHECVLLDDVSWSTEGSEYDDYAEETHFWKGKGRDRVPVV
jgi:hypothetical protein